MAQKRFTAQVDDWVKESNIRLEAVIIQSTNDVIDDAQTPVSKGGRMRVDTGFLRASGHLSLNGMPSGPSRGNKGETYESADISAGLAGFKAGGKIFFGWTAAYARARENKDGFLALAAQKWKKIVAANAAKLRG